MKWLSEREDDIATRLIRYMDAHERMHTRMEETGNTVCEMCEALAESTANFTCSGCGSEQRTRSWNADGILDCENKWHTRER